MVEHPVFAASYELVRKTDIPEWRIQSAIQTREREAANKGVRGDMIRDLTQRLEGIREGSDMDALSYSSLVYLGDVLTRGKDQHPVSRLEGEVGSEIALAALEGFRACLTKDLQLTPTDVAKKGARGREYRVGQTVGAAIHHLVACHPREYSNLPESTLRLAVAFSADGHTSMLDEAWLLDLYRTRPAVAADAFPRRA